MKKLDQNQINRLILSAHASTRKRINHNLHTELTDPVNRFFNVMLSDTYVQPHRHNGENRWELFVIIRGEAAVICFEEDGSIISRDILNPHSANIAIEIPGNTWHSVAITQDDTVLFESKPGPYEITSDKSFAPWAPKESDRNTQEFIFWFIHGKIGSSPPS